MFLPLTFQVEWDGGREAIWLFDDGVTWYPLRPELTKRASGPHGTVPNMGVLTSVHGRPGAGMDWRVTIELSGADGTKQTHEVARGGGSDPDSSLDPLGLTLDDSKACAITEQSTLSPASELVPDRCTPEYERTLAKLGAWLPYRCARRFLSEFFPIGDDLPWHETIRRRTAKVGAGLERETVAGENAAASAARGDDDGIDRRWARPSGARSSGQHVRGGGSSGQ